MLALTANVLQNRSDGGKMLKTYKATLTISANGNAKHNDREQNITDGHVDYTKTKENSYWSWNGQGFAASEKSFYKQQYSDWIKSKNEMYIQSRHRERCITVSQLLTDARTKPKEMILQIGKVHDHVSVDMLNECFQDFRNILESYPDNFHLLNWAVHADEATPHAHIRYIMDYKDKNGNSHISQRQALKEMGFDAPIQDMPDSLRYNNPVVVFTSELREHWYNICEKHGIPIDRNADRTNQEHYKILEYKINAMTAELNKCNLYIKTQTEKISDLERELIELQNEKESLESQIQDKQLQLEELQQETQAAEEELQNIRTEYEQYEEREKERKQRHEERKAREAKALASIFTNS